jgi:hypothetical protein
MARSSYCPKDGNTLISKDNCSGCPYFEWSDGEFPGDAGTYECTYGEEKDEDEIKEEEEDED